MYRSHRRKTTNNQGAIYLGHAIQGKESSPENDNTAVNELCAVIKRRVRTDQIHPEPQHLTHLMHQATQQLSML